MQKITPCLWFDGKAEEAARFYVSVFANSRITKVYPFSGAGAGPQGSAMLVTFELEGQSFSALNGGPGYHFTPAISLFVDCRTQAEVDRLWAKLSEGGEEGQCGWLTDRYGVSWQIVPRALIEMIEGDNPAKTTAVTRALMRMKKLVIDDLKRAFEAA